MATPLHCEQHSKSYNNLLPYAECLDDEAAKHMAMIKYNLGRAVLFHELTPGVQFWCNRLEAFLRFFGYKFSKSDHVDLIKLLYQLMIIPGLEPQFVKGFASVLYKLLRKEKLLTRDDLQLPWRPLYQIVKNVRGIKPITVGLWKYPAKFLDCMNRLIKVARNYFPATATQEMLYEWRPHMCIFDVLKIPASSNFCMFLPTQLSTHEHESGYKLWLNEMLEYWLHCTHSLPTVSENYMKLFARLTESNVGCIDWNPYLAKIFSQFLSEMNLPVMGAPPQRASRRDVIVISMYARWFVYMMGGKCVVLDYLEKLFATLKSFYHPSNHGSFSTVLLGLLQSITNHFITRLHKERFAIPTWKNQIADDQKISDEHIERFVLMLIDISLLAMYNKSGSSNAASALQKLALLRADLVLPSLLERTVEALETVVEPHQVTATLQCITSVSRTLVNGGDHYPAAPTHILPLLLMVLPGIDPNDFHKSMSSFTLIAAIIGRIPLVNCMEALNSGMEMTDIERELCIVSGQFEDYVLQLIDRCFVLVENLSTEQVAEQDNKSMETMNVQEGMLGMGLTSIIQAVFTQASTQIFKSALDCLFIFVTSRVLEVNIAGKLVSDMCRAASKAHPTVTLKKVVPFLCSVVKNLASVDGVQTEEHVDPKLLWYLEVLSEFVHCEGTELLPYSCMLTEVLDLTLHLKCKKAYSIAGKLMKNILCSCTETYVREYRSLNISFDLPPTEHFYIRDWGKHGYMKDLNISWHIPGDSEQQFVNKMLERYMLPEIEIIKGYIVGNPLPREELHQRLQILAVCLYSSASLLPMWSNEPYAENVAPPSLVARHYDAFVTNPPDYKPMACCVTRKHIAIFVHQLLEFMLMKNEDDTKAFRIVSRIYDCLVLHNGVNSEEFFLRWKSACSVKKALADKLHGNKCHMRAILIEKIQLQHDMRVLTRTSAPYTLIDQMVVNDILKLSTSVYTEVRIDSQKVLNELLSVFDYSSRSILPQLIENLKEKTVSHEKLKGTLYIMIYSTQILYLVSHYWEVMAVAWPAIVKANHSEKPSIVSLINTLCCKVCQKYDTVGIERKISEDCHGLAHTILNSQNLSSSFYRKHVIPDGDMIKHALNQNVMTNEGNLRHYHVLDEKLAALLETKNVHWRCAEYCMKFLQIMKCKFVPISLRTATIFVTGLTSESLILRQISLRCVNALLYQHKPKFEKDIVDYMKYGIDPQLRVQPGDARDDSRWLQFHWDREAKSQDELEEQTFIDKTHWGHQAWPLQLKTYSKSCLVKRNFDANNQYHTLLKNFFSNKPMMEAFFRYLSLEVNKGEDKFRTTHFIFFELLCRNFGSMLLEDLKNVIKGLFAENNESKHLCGVEMIAGLIRGSRNWPHSELESLWSFLCPFLNGIFSTNIMPEILQDWCRALASSTESRDPNRFHALYRMLTANPLSTQGGSFGDSSRLYLLMVTIGQQEWRVSELYKDVLEYLKPFLCHPFKNVRDQLGSALSLIFMFDVKYGGYTPTLSPRLHDFVETVLPDLKALTEEVLHATPTLSKNQTEAQESGINNSVPIRNCTTSISHFRNEESLKKDRLAKTVLCCLSNMAYTFQPMNKEIFCLVTELLVLEAREDDKEIISLCKQTFSVLATKQLSNDVIEIALPELKKVCSLTSWNARKAGLNYLKLMVFHNLFKFDKDDIKKDIKEVIVQTIQDEQLEVREVASSLLSGLVHYNYFAVTGTFRILFSKMAKTNIKSARHGVVLTMDDQQNNISALRVKHGGVLGLSAYVLAFPYEVPEWMPETLLHLGKYIHSYPQIQATVKKTLSEFRRTHYDNWHVHRRRFTDDQLSEMTDLLASPSYYA